MCRQNDSLADGQVTELLSGGWNKKAEAIDEMLTEDERGGTGAHKGSPFHNFGIKCEMFPSTGRSLRTDLALDFEIQFLGSRVLVE